MDQSEIKFGDKLFLYGEYLFDVEDIEDYENNAVKGYTLINGSPVQMSTINDDASISGFVVDFLYGRSLEATVPPTFFRLEMIDVTDNLVQTLPLPAGTKVWMPTTQLLDDYLE